MAKSQRVLELEEAIIQAVDVLDEADSSRMGLIESTDKLRAILAESYGDNFDDDLSDYQSSESDDDSSDFDDEPESEDFDEEE